MIGTEVSEIQFGRTRIGYQVRRSRRRRTVAVAVDPRIGVLLRAPENVPLVRLDRVVHAKARWILDRLRHVRRTENGLAPREFVSGESYLYLGRSYRLKVVPCDEPGDAKLIGGWIQVPIAKSHDSPERAVAVRTTLESWYRNHARLRLPERVSRWFNKVGVDEPRIVVRDQQRRWASCDARGVVRFNWRIIQAPLPLVDYVVVHELVHLKDRNHTRGFWTAVGRVLPDYERRREELRRIGVRLEW
jgi:predicted metal-dependent hydrolase